MNDQDRLFYFVVGILFCLFVLAIAGLILYDQIDMKIIIVISKAPNVTTITPVSPL